MSYGIHGRKRASCMIEDKGKAICEDCHGLVGITYKLRDVPFNDGSGIVKNILSGVCDKCNQVICIPHQSTPAIKASRVYVRHA